MINYLRKPGSDPNTFSFKQRRKRMLQLAKLLGNAQNLQVLDIGGTVSYWESNAPFLEPGTIANLEIVNTVPDQIVEGMAVVGGGILACHAGDATRLDTLHRDSYDLVFSNSVIEHVGNLGSQKEMADAIRALGKFHFIQTPSRRFPIETHFHVPFFAFLPLGLRTEIHRRFNCGFMGREPDWLRARIACEQTRLLSRSELAALFPESRIVPERVLGFTKSWMVSNLPEPLGRQGTSDQSEAHSSRERPSIASPAPFWSLLRRQDSTVYPPLPY